METIFELAIGNSSKMKPPRNALKARHNFLAGSFQKREPPKKNLKSKLKSSNSEVDDTQQKVYSETNWKINCDDQSLQ